MVRKSSPQFRTLLRGKRGGESLAGNAVQQILRQLQPLGRIEFDDFFVKYWIHVAYHTEMERFLQSQTSKSQTSYLFVT